MKRWDVFISHASEDKETIAEPLANCLRSAGLTVWLDRQALHLGDSLREKIDEGLSESTFGVIVLSRHFLDKGWPKRELSGLMALEEGGEKVILPVWHGITKAELTAYSPILADRLAVDTISGVPNVAKAILDVVLSSRGDSPAFVSPNSTRLLLNLLERNPTPVEISAFFKYHPRLLGPHAVPNIWSDIKVADRILPFVTMQPQAGATLPSVNLIAFGCVSGPLFAASRSFADDIVDVLRTLTLGLTAASQSGGLEVSRDTGVFISTEDTDVTAILFARRREALTLTEKDHLKTRLLVQRYRSNPTKDILQFPDVMIRTYDAIVSSVLAAGV